MQLHTTTNTNYFSVSIKKPIASFLTKSSLYNNYKLCILIKNGFSNSFINTSHKIAYYTKKSTLQVCGTETSTLKLTKKTPTKPTSALNGNTLATKTAQHITQEQRKPQALITKQNHLFTDVLCVLILFSY